MNDSGKEIISTDMMVKIAHQVLIDMHEGSPQIMAGRDGGHLVIMEMGEMAHTHSAQVLLEGHSVSEEKMTEYRINAHERAKRLKKLAEEEGHISSYQSRKHEEGKHGGAIRVGRWIISFAGLSEWLNEYISVAIAKKMDMVTHADIAEIMKASGNRTLKIAA